MSSKTTITSYGRFKGAPWFAPISESLIFIGGAGGIGSHLGFQLARTGAHIIVADQDTVAEENLAGQLYGIEDIGKKKVVAMTDVIRRLCEEINVTPLDEWISKEYGEWQNYLQMCDVVCVGFDNLEARRVVYDFWKEYGKEGSLFVDGRLNFEEGQVFVVSKDSPVAIKEAYEATYFSASERVELPCTMKATTHCGVLIASLMTSQIVNWFANNVVDSFKRDVMNIEFHLPVMIIEASKFKAKKHEHTEQPQ